MRVIHDLTTGAITEDPNWQPEPAADLTAEQWEARVRAEGARRLAEIAAPYAPEERETWHRQEREARAYQSDASTAVPFLDAAAAARGVLVADLAANIIAKSDVFAAATGAVTGAQATILAMDPRPADPTDPALWP